MDKQTEAMSIEAVTDFYSHESWFSADKAPTNLFLYLSLKLLVSAGTAAISLKGIA